MKFFKVFVVVASISAGLVFSAGTPAGANGRFDAYGLADDTRGQTSISPSYDTGCSLDHAGVVRCWGNNPSGQVGNGTTNDAATPSIVDLGSKAISVQTSNAHTCALLIEGTMKCWGNNVVGQVGDGTTTNRTSPVAVDLGTDMTAVAFDVGVYHTCAILNDGSLKCWGYNNNGQIGDGTTTTRTSPVTVDLGANMTALDIAAGYYHTCAILNDGSMKCWGLNNSGQIGDGTTTHRSSPVAVDLPVGMSPILTAVATSAGYDTTCAVLNDGSLYCWGANSWGQIGDGTTTDRTSPEQVSADTWIDVLSFRYGNCGIKSDRSLWCWGYNGNGSLGDGTWVDRNEPVEVDLGTNKTVRSIHASDADGYNVCAILNDGVTKCWGQNTDVNGLGGVFLGVTGQQSSPTTVSAFDYLSHGIKSLEVGLVSSCVIKNNGELYCWGNNDYEHLVTGGSDWSTVVHIDLGTNMTAESVSIGNFFICAILNDGTLKCWGRNHYGQLGVGDTTDRDDPTTVNLPLEAIAVDADAFSTTVLLADGSAEAWGSNYQGRLGDGTEDSSSSPILVDHGDKTAVAVDGRGCALLNDGSVECSGDNAYGQLGDGSTNDSLTRVAMDLGNNMTATAISVGTHHVCVILNDGSVKCAGRNNNGQIGDGSSSNRSTPVAVDLGTNKTAVSISTYYYTVCAVLNDASVKCWGYNYQGEIGDGTQGTGTNRSEPVDLAFSVEARKVGVGGYGSCALLHDSVHCWGYDNDNSLGLRGISPISSTRTIDSVSVSTQKRVAFTDNDLEGLVPNQNVEALALNVKVFNPSQSGYLAVYNCDAAEDRVSALTLNKGETVQGAVISKVSADAGEVCIEARDSNHNLMDVDRLIVYTTGYISTDNEQISPIDSTRTIDVSSVVSEKRVAFTDSDLDGIVPETGVGALVLNVKVFNPSQSGYLAVYNCDAAEDRVSALTLNAGETVQGAVISKVSAGGGEVCVEARDSSHNPISVDRLIVYTTGYVIADNTQIVPVDSTRTIDVSSVSSEKRVAFTDSDLDGIVPETGVGALALNVKVFNPSQSGYLAVFNCDASNDRVSALTLNAGETVQGAVISKVSAGDGEVCVEARDSGHNPMSVDRLIVYTTGYIYAPITFTPGYVGECEGMGC